MFLRFDLPQRRVVGTSFEVESPCLVGRQVVRNIFRKRQRRLKIIHIMSNNAKINVKGTEITIIQKNGEDYVSITDMIRAKDGDFFISDWLRNRNTLEFMGIWEGIYNPNFNYGEFAIIKSKSGRIE